MCAEPRLDDPLDQDSRRILAILDEASAQPRISPDALRSLRRKVEERAFNLVVAGAFNRGKSTLINALVGRELLPTGVLPLTSIVTTIRDAAVEQAEVIFANGERQRIALDRLADFATERGNPDNVKAVGEVAIGVAAPWLAGGVVLADTPGIGSVHEHNTETTLRYLAQADAIVFVVSVEQPLNRDELAFIASNEPRVGKVFCVLNKIDQLSDDEVADSIAFVAKVIGETAGSDVPIYPVSALLALRGRIGNDPSLVARSRLAAFVAALRRFLGAERGAVWLASLQKSLLRLLDESRLSAQLELRALVESADALMAKTAAFAERKAALLQLRGDISPLLHAEAANLVAGRIEPDLDRFRKVLTSELETQLEPWAGALKPQGSAALKAGLEERLVDETRRRLDEWRAQEETTIAAAFDALCDRHAQRMEAAIGELLAFAARLFDIPFAREKAAHAWHGRSRFHYKFWTVTPSLGLITHSVVLALPGFLGSSLILRDARRRAADLVDVQIGRLRHDFAEQVKGNAQAFLADAAARIEAVADSTARALAAGAAMRDEDEARASAHRQSVGAALAALASLRQRTAQLLDAPAVARTSTGASASAFAPAPAAASVAARAVGERLPQEPGQADPDADRQ